MNKIHDKANKFFYDVRKKKIKVGNIKNPKDNKQDTKDTLNISDVTNNSCSLCEKVFISSNYLLKHMLRRHSENLIKLHRRCLHPDANNSSDLKNLFTFLEEEFLELKTELLSVKQAIGYKDVQTEDNEVLEESRKESLARVSDGGKSRVDSDISVADIYSKELENLKEKVHDIESNVQCLHGKFEESDMIVKTQEVLFKEDIHKHRILNEQKLLREQESQFAELRQILLKELKCVLSKQLHENNVEWKSKFAELKCDIDHTISDIKKQVYSPDYVKAFEKRCEQKIVNFLGSPRQKVTKKRNSRDKNKLSVTKNHNTVLQNIKTFETENFDSRIINSSKRNSVNQSHNQKSSMSCVTPEELSYLVTEKLSHFNILPDTSRLSCAEYEEKLKLINSDKDRFNKKYHNFSEIYNSINICADHRVQMLSKRRCKKQRKIRFSDSLVSSNDNSCNLNPSGSDFLNKAFPVLEDKNYDHAVSDSHRMAHSDNKISTVSQKLGFAISESKGFIFRDVGGGGDNSCNFPKVYQNSVEILEPTSDKEYNISSPVVDAEYGRKTKNFISNDCLNSTVYFTSDKKIDCASVDVQNNSYLTLDDYAKHEETFLKSLKNYKGAEFDQNLKVEDSDDNSCLESLSSWDGEENFSVKDTVQ